MVEGYKSNDVDHSIVAEEGQAKDMEKVLSKRNKRTKADERKTDEGDPHLSESIVVYQPLVKSNEGGQYLVKNNEHEDDGQSKKKKNKQLSDKSNHKEKNEFKSNEGDRCLAKSNEDEDDDQGKKIKKRKQNDKGKSKESNEDDGQGKKKKKSDKGKHDQCLAKSNDDEDNDQEKKMKRKRNDKVESKESNEVDDQAKNLKIKKKTEAGIGESPNPAPDGTSKPKRVTFSDTVEVCCDGLIRGKRFTPKEDKKIKDAVLDYIESHGLGNEGLDIVLHCRSHPEVRHCWKEIGAALPDRPHGSVYYRAHILFERSKKRKWTTEELDFIRKVQHQHGSDWKSIAEALGKTQLHVKDAWRRIKLANTNRGRWSQDEYQQLFDLVNLDLRMRALEDYKNSNHGMLRDNICWEATANKLATRSSSPCCKKWYEHLTSPMVAQGIWSDTDDYRMLNALFTLDACCMEEVDWDNLVEHRSADACRKRWNQMVQYIGDHGRKSFAEQVEILAKRFCPDLLEAREAFDSIPVIC